MGLKGEKWRRVFSRRYTLALLSLAVLWSGVSVVQYRMISGERNRAEVIALAAEQSALSQRIAFLATGLDPEDPGCLDASVCVDLLATTERMQMNHDILTGVVTSPSLSQYLAPAWAIYLAGPTPFSEEVEAFLDAACELVHGEVPDGVSRETLIRRIENAGTDTVMQTHQLIVEVLQAEARRAIQFAAGVTVLAWLMTLVLLSLISARVFRPMAERLLASFVEMEEAKDEALAAAETAARATKVRGEFLRTASHELKTPLNAIMGLADVIRAGDGDADKFLKEMSHASDHLLSMLNTILDTHKLDDGLLEMAKDRVPVCEELLNTAKIAEDFCLRKGLDFRVRIDVDEGFEAEGDAPRLRQICLTLLDNAVRYTPEGFVSFGAKLEGDGEERTLEVTVEDSGIGIEKSRQEQIFDRFAATDTVTGRTGLGLGLSFAKTVAEMMGGRIMLNSTVGEGSKITMRLPLTRATECTGKRAPSGPGDARILIVDDNMPNRLVADAMITMLGGSTVLASDGRQAIDLAKRGRFDLILMDIAMPGVDGVEATRAIREGHGPNRRTPIVAVTAHVAQEEVGDLISVGFDAVLHKPLRKRLMARIVETYTPLRPAAETRKTGPRKGVRQDGIPG